MMFNRLLRRLFAVVQQMLHHDGAQVIEFPTGRRAG